MSKAKTLLLLRPSSQDGHSIEEIYENLHYNFFEPEGVSDIYVIDRKLNLFQNITNILSFGTKIIHITGDIYYYAIFLWLFRPIIITIHDIGHYKSLSGIKKVLYKYIWLKIPVMLSKKIVTISEYTKSDVSHHLKVNPQKLELIYNPIPKEIINNENYYEKSNDKILIVGTSSNKNIETIFYAVKDLNIQLIIIGKLTQNHILILQELNISYHNVYDLEYSKVLDFYKQVDLVVFISKHEGFGMPIIEANALGTPIIVSSIPPLKEIGLDAVYYIKDENDFNEVRDAIKLLLSNDKLKNDLIQRGKDNIVRFNPKNIAAKYIQIYNSI